MSGAPPPHRRGCRAGRRRGPRPARRHTCAPSMTGRAGRETLTGNPAPGRRLVRPVSPFIPLVSCAGVLLAWGLVAHNSGAGWVQAVGDVLAGVLGVGLVAPAVVAARARVAIFEAPSDGTSGLPVELAATANNRLRIRPLDPPGPEAFVGPHRMPASPRPGRRFWERWPGDASIDGTEPVTLVPEHRGVHDRVVLEVATAAPFGFLWWRKIVVLELPRGCTWGRASGRLSRCPGGTPTPRGATSCTPRSRLVSHAGFAPTVPGITAAGCTGPPPLTAGS